jgi:hypothetical protein
MQLDFTPQPLQIGGPVSPERIRARLQRLNIAMKKASTQERRASLQAEVDRLARLPPSV